MFQAVTVLPLDVAVVGMLACLNWVGFAVGFHVLLGHILGHEGSCPVGSVQAACQMVPMNSLLVAMHSPLLKQMSGEPVVLLTAQQPLCVAV